MRLPATIPALVQSAATEYGAAEAVADGTRRVSFTELADLARRAAADCIRRGVHAGDLVAIWAPNTLDWVVAALGALTAGAALVPLNTRYKAGEAAWILDRSRAVVTYCSPPFLGNDYPAMLAGRAGTVVLDESLWCEVSAGEAAEIDRRLAELTPGDTGDVIFTSGTTGRPKGVVTTQAQSLRVFDTWAEVVGSARRRPLPRRQPVLPHLRLQGRDPRLPAARRDDRAAAGVRRRSDARPPRARADQRAARAAGALPVAARLTRSRRPRLELAPPHRDRRGRRTGRPGRATARRARGRDRADGVRADRSHGYGDHVPARATIRRRSRRHRAGRSPTPRYGSSTPPVSRCRSASRARSSCAATT